MGKTNWLCCLRLKWVNVAVLGPARMYCDWTYFWWLRSGVESVDVWYWTVCEGIDEGC